MGRRGGGRLATEPQLVAMIAGINRQLSNVEM
jgi:hypothetical protein